MLFHLEGGGAGYKLPKPFIVKQAQPPKPDLNVKSFADFFYRQRFEMGAGLKKPMHGEIAFQIII